MLDFVNKIATLGKPLPPEPESRPRPVAPYREPVRPQAVLSQAEAQRTVADWLLWMDRCAQRSDLTEIWLEMLGRAYGHASGRERP